jgi:hypothetical protein
MADSPVTVAKYANSVEAELAKNFLTGHGIPAQVSGDSSMTFNLGPLAGLVQLLVRESDRARAAELLADHFDAAELNRDWQDEAQADTAVWVCSLCGTTTSNDVAECQGCNTPRDAVQTRRGRRIDARSAWSEESFDKQEEVTLEKPDQSQEMVEPKPAIEALDLSMLYSRDLAWRAFLGAVAPLVILPVMCPNPAFLLVCLPFVGYSVWCLIRLGFYSTGDLGKASWVYLLGALAAHGLYLFLFVLFVRALLGVR